jgi:hypothetical protein
MDSNLALGAEHCPQPRSKQLHTPEIHAQACEQHRSGNSNIQGWSTGVQLRVQAVVVGVTVAFFESISLEHYAFHKREYLQVEQELQSQL